MINYTIAEFLGIFLILLPVFVFATTIIFWGLRKMFDRFFDEEEDEEKIVYYKHIGGYAPPRSRRGRGEIL
jgi:predicted permease